MLNPFESQDLEVGNQRTNHVIVLKQGYWVVNIIWSNLVKQTWRITKLNLSTIMVMSRLSKWGWPDYYRCFVMSTQDEETRGCCAWKVSHVLIEKQDQLHWLSDHESLTKTWNVKHSNPVETKTETKRIWNHQIVTNMVRMISCVQRSCFLMANAQT